MNINRETDALIIVDVQNDFVSGSLAVPGADAVIDPIIRLAKQFDVVVASRDYHPSDHVSFSDDPTFEDKSWPAHCVVGTDGCNYEARIGKLVEGRVVHEILKGTDKNVEAYSAFDGKNINQGALLSKILLTRGIERVFVVGLALDYCVKATALSSQDLGWDTFVVLDATQAVTAQGASDSVEELIEAGVEIIMAADAVPVG
jgi:nicotinamidase-related amidase